MNVLISSAGRRGALIGIFERALDAAGVSGSVFACDRSQLTAGGQLAARLFRVPPCTQSDFIPSVLALCAEFDIKLVVPTIDTELAEYAAHASDFALAGVVVLSSSTETVRIANDKRLTHDWFVSNGFRTVATTDPSTAAAHPGDWPLPLMAKPIRGSSSIGVRVITTATELRSLIGSAMIVQHLAVGDEYTIDVWVDPVTSRCRSAIPRQRLEVRSGEVSKAVTRHIPSVERAASELAEALPGAFGPLTIQGFYDGDSITFIEINPRFGGGYPLSVEAGAESAVWAVKHAMNIPTGEDSDCWTAGLVMLRYDAAVFCAADHVGI